MSKNLEVIKYWEYASKASGIDRPVVEFPKIETEQGILLSTIYCGSKFYTIVSDGKVVGAQSYDSMCQINAADMENPADNYIRLRSFLRDAGELYKMQMRDSKAHLEQTIPHGTFDGFEIGEDARG